MANCYVCGRPLKPGSRALRRKVRTGEWLRRTKRDAPPTSVNVHFGMRVVCPWCARRIDRERLRAEAVQWAEFGFALLVLLVVLFSHLF